MRTPRASDDGMVTAEMLVIAPIAAALVVVALWAIGVATTHAQVSDAARHAARAVARGESVADARRVARDHAPRGSSISVQRAGHRVDVEVSASRRIKVGLLPDLGRWIVRGQASAAVENP